jgi:hypothetical protein
MIIIVFTGLYVQGRCMYLCDDIPLYLFSEFKHTFIEVTCHVAKAKPPEVENRLYNPYVQ